MIGFAAVGKHKLGYTSVKSKNQMSVQDLLQQIWSHK